jgi:peptidoglycan/LPS O-acetylase OafA/YrhL
MSAQTRHANIDLLRSIAILSVVFFHCVNMSKVTQWFWDIAEGGAIGVDLFFVLSGFLVGGLYFKELKNFGHVDISRFIGRRIFRTIPMYYLIMPLAYLATYAVRKMPFDWFYLFFLQNYEDKMPFYLVSWSLCIEEHFYLFMPFVLPFLLDKNNQLKRAWWLSLCLVPMVLRIIAYFTQGGHEGFGYFSTATHFRFEGLLIGVGLAYYCLNQAHLLKPLVKYKKFIYALTVVSVFSYAYIPTVFRTCFFVTWVSVAFALSLLVLYFSPPIKVAQTTLNRSIALSSYSTYLVHSLVIHVCLKIFGVLNISSPFLTVPLMFMASLLSGFMVYTIFEKKIMLWRDRYLPTKQRVEHTTALSLQRETPSVF